MLLQIKYVTRCSFILKRNIDLRVTCMPMQSLNLSIFLSFLIVRTLSLSILEGGKKKIDCIQIKVESIHSILNKASSYRECTSGVNHAQCWKQLVSNPKTHRSSALNFKAEIITFRSLHQPLSLICQEALITCFAGYLAFILSKTPLGRCTTALRMT